MYESNQRHDLIEILFLGFLGNRKPVYKSENTTATAGQKLKNAHSGVSQHKTVNSQGAQEDGNQQKGSGVF